MANAFAKVQTMQYQILFGKLVFGSEKWSNPCEWEICTNEYRKCPLFLPTNVLNHTSFAEIRAHPKYPTVIHNMAFVVEKRKMAQWSIIFSFSFRIRNVDAISWKLTSCPHILLNEPTIYLGYNM